MFRFCAFIGLMINCSMLPAQEDGVQAELRKMEGTWRQVSVLAPGGISFKDEEDPPKVTVTIAGEKWIEKSKAAGGTGIVETFKIDPTKMPKQIDWTIEFNNNSGKVQLTFVGIYRLEGDTLTVCQTVPFGGGLDAAKITKRPTEFKTTAEDNFGIIEFKRMQEPKP